MEVPSGFADEPFADYVLPPLQTSPRDIPMALLYELDEEAFPAQTSLILRGSIGVPKTHQLAKEVLDFNDLVGIAPLLRQAQSITTISRTDLFDGLEWRGFEEPSSHICIMPLVVSGKKFGYLVVGTNPRQAVDGYHELFMRELATKTSAIALALVSADEIRKRAERLERELADSERQIRYMAQHASVGMQHLAIDGTMMWANEQYYFMTEHPRAEKLQYKNSFIDVFIDEDQPKALAAWKLLLQGQPNVSAELRLKRLFTPPSGEAEPACILSLSFPYLEDGKVKSIMTCITDVSSLKWAEASEARNAADAREAKRQQEEFIDLVSHELRNPLSAIFQLADTIISSFPEGEEVGTPEDNPLCEALRSNIEAASTILMCAKHQKRIVDDVLTLSKLEYMMLAVAPRPVQLPKLFERSVRMFDADMLESEIDVRIVGDPSLKELNIDWVMCDPSRITQIFINLLTNAIKFTKMEDSRQITISYGATLSTPRDSFPKKIIWAPNQKDEVEDLTLNDEWGKDEPLYVTVTVKDTGVGMNRDQIKKLFSRFQQASVRTSIKYGGSGLGLFISQKLTEKLGGEIGVLSEPGKGSTFAFYVKSRRTVKEMKSLIKKNSADSYSARPQLLIRSVSSNLRVGVPETDLNRMHVLLVEDNVVNQKVLRQQLTNLGCVVSVANHGAEALKFLETTNAWRQDTNSDGLGNARHGWFNC
jgi:signal transduction histidine kinase